MSTGTTIVLFWENSQPVTPTATTITTASATRYQFGRNLPRAGAGGRRSDAGPVSRSPRGWISVWLTPPTGAAGFRQPPA
ncbi:hypothetical protein, partial [Streptosporangium saharense]|uniref:hypothetical protein n=1 Tax=Streptosporangium saharense TaxID=1706840 RepID=UPI003332507D